MPADLLSRTFLLAFIFAPCLGLAGVLNEALENYIWNWDGDGNRTQIVFQKDGTVLTRDRKTWKWQILGPSTARLTLNEGQVVDIEFDADFTRFRNVKGSASSPSGTRGQLRAASVAPGAGRAAPDPNNMTLSRDWMPHNVHTRKELLDSIEFYSRAALGGAERGQEKTPSVIWGPVKWLMPLQDALKTLPRNSRRQREFKVMNLAFPQHSLQVTMMAVVGVEVPDRCNQFKYVSFICDMDQRVIGLQLVHNNPAMVPWDAPGPDGVREPYFNFIEDRWNGSTTNCVPYQVRPAGPGVTLIKTALFDSPTIGTPPYAQGPCPGYVVVPYGRYLESVHWYLTAPLAQKLLEIVETTRREGLQK